MIVTVGSLSKKAEEHSRTKTKYHSDERADAHRFGIAVNVINELHQHTSLRRR